MLKDVVCASGFQQHAIFRAALASSLHKLFNFIRAHQFGQWNSRPRKLYRTSGTMESP